MPQSPSRRYNQRATLDAFTANRLHSRRRPEDRSPLAGDMLGQEHHRKKGGCSPATTLVAHASTVTIFFNNSI